MINDMTKGDPLKLLFCFSVPLLIGNIFQQLYNIADIVIVGRTLGMNALAAVGAISPIFFFLMFVVVGLTNGFAVITGQRFGAKDTDGVRKSATVSTVLSTVFTIVFSALLAIFMNTILAWMNVPKEIYKDASLLPASPPRSGSRWHGGCWHRPHTTAQRCNRLRRSGG